MVTIKGENYKDGSLVLQSNSYKEYQIVTTKNEFYEDKVIHLRTHDINEALETYERISNQ